MRAKGVMKIGFFVFVICILLGVTGSGKGYDKEKSEDFTTNAAPEEQPSEPQMATGDTVQPGNDQSAENSPLANRKIIQNKYITMETLDFDNVTVQIENLVAQYLGYIESSEVDGNSINQNQYDTRNARYTLRVPSVGFMEFINDLKAMGNVVEENVSKQDVTLQYVDLQARIDALKVQEQRLLELLANTTDLSQVIEVEDKLSDVRYEIETYTATLNNLDNLVDYGTVNLELKEVIKETVVEKPAVTVGEKISKGFKNSVINVKDFFVAFFIFIITASPYLIVWAAVIVGIIFCIKKFKTHAERKEAKKIAKEEEKK